VYFTEVVNQYFKILYVTVGYSKYLPRANTISEKFYKYCKTTMGLFDFFTGDIAIDLGTANTLIIHKDKVVVDEPSIIAIDRKNSKVIAIGKQAMQMHEKTHREIETIRPLKDGVIADFTAAEQMIRGLIKMINSGSRFFTPSYRMVICIPSGITEVEKRAVKDSAEHCGAREVYMIHEPIAAAIGIGINIDEPVGSMIVDIGGGTTEIAVIALSGIVCEQSIKTAGDVFTQDILNYMRRQHNLLIGERSAERIKMEVGSAMAELDEPPADYEVRGRDLMTGIPKTIKVSYSEIAFCLDKYISKVEDGVLKTLEMSPPELSADIYNNGIYLTGGGALLKGLDQRLALKTKLPIHIADDPLRAVVRGTGIALKNLEAYKPVLMS
jgi:rod shape-determining protein MreB